jgi:hypothetical protein
MKTLVFVLLIGFCWGVVSSIRNNYYRAQVWENGYLSGQINTLNYCNGKFDSDSLFALHDVDSVKMTQIIRYRNK